MPYEQDCVHGVPLARESPVVPETLAERANDPPDILGSPAENEPRVNSRCVSRLSAPSVALGMHWSEGATWC